MSKKNPAMIVFVTCASTSEAIRIARSAVEKHLAACGNILAGRVQSIYRWKGQVEHAKECLIILKTAKAALSRLESEVKRLHSYEVPEFIAFEIKSGARDYLAWLSGNVR
jgi:periplasmic divalent cation tolerance protein